MISPHLRLLSALGPWLPAVLALALLLVAWFPVLAGSRVLIGGDVLYSIGPPWAAEKAAHRPANTLVVDPAQQFLPWQQLTADAFRHGRLPLWDPYALSGKPLLANDQSAPFSPFTWLALFFKPATGLSLAMIAKLLVAGFGMAFYLRALGARGIGPVAGGVAYAGSSFMTVWLASPQAAVAALLPWIFAAVELYLKTGRRRALASLALAVGLQFLAGHAETSLHVGLGLAVYGLIRLALAPRLVFRMGALIAAGVVGVMLGGAQLLPFLNELGQSSLVRDRAAGAVGSGHLNLSAVTSWFVPNAVGNPGIDGLYGRYPNYNEATGFAGVTMLVLAPIGLAAEWLRERGPALALAGVGLVSAGIVYGPLSPLAGRLPGLAEANNIRLLVLTCFAVAALGGLGLASLEEASLRGRQRRLVGVALSMLGMTAAVGVGLGGLVLTQVGAGVGALLPTFPSYYIGFWTLLAALALLGALALAAAAHFAAGRVAAPALGLLVSLEAALFVIPYQPLVRPDEVPPASTVATWLQDHSGDGSIASTGKTLIPETATYYGVRDVRGYDVLVPPRARLYWSAADPGYHDRGLVTFLERPDIDWLKRAGVAYIVTAGAVVPGSAPVESAEGVVVSAVAGRPYAYATGTWSAVADAAAARRQLLAQPAGPPVIEGVQAGSSQALALVSVQRESPEQITVQVRTDRPVVVVIHESWSPDWRASLDGRTVADHPADLIFQGVLVPLGAHTLELRYEPAGVTRGLALSGAGVAGLLALAIVPLPRRRH